MPIKWMRSVMLIITYAVFLVLAVINVVVSIPLAMRWQGVGAAIGTTLALFAGQYAMMN